MNLNKVILLLIAVIFIGLVFLPNAVSTFKNEHTWQQSDNIVCTSCHADITTALESSDNYHHNSKSLGVGSTEEACKYCHQTQFGDDFGSYGDWSRESSSGRVHSAFTVECLDCHGGSIQNDDLNAVDIIDDFNTTSNEAHLPLYKSAQISTLMEGANEACISCHTGIAIQDGGFFVVNTGLNFTAEKIQDTWSVTFGIYNP